MKQSDEDNFKSDECHKGNKTRDVTGDGQPPLIRVAGLFVSYGLRMVGGLSCTLHFSFSILFQTFLMTLKINFLTHKSIPAI